MDYTSPDPTGLVPMVKQIDWLTANHHHDDPHVLVTWVKQIARLWGDAGQPHHLLHQPDGVDDRVAVTCECLATA